MAAGSTAAAFTAAAGAAVAGTAADGEAMAFGMAAIGAAVWNSGWWGPAVAAGVLSGAAIASYPYWGGGWIRRRLLAGSPDLRRLWQFPRPAVRQRLLTFTPTLSTRASRERGPFHLRAGEKTPPVIGFGTPVVVGNEIGKPRRERKAR